MQRICSIVSDDYMGRFGSTAVRAGANRRMTSVDVVFRYGLPPGELTMRALDNLREVYGIRRILFKSADQTVRVEFDATRLNEDTVASLLRRSGLDVKEKLQLV